MDQKRSQKHHYLPVNYLNGFTDDQGLFFVYDKKEDQIVQKAVTPKSVFFENNLNTIALKDECSDFLEGLYTQTENILWAPFETIRRSKSTDQIQPLDRMHLYLFLTLLYWRLPSNFNQVKSFSSKAFAHNNEIDYFQLKSRNGDVSNEMIEQMRGSESFNKSVRLILPFAPFLKNKEWFLSVVKWKFVYIEPNTTAFITGDNPIILKDESGEAVDPLGEFIFPISSNILLANCDHAIKKELDPAFVLQANIAIMENAKRFVICRSKEFLQGLVKYYKIYSQYGKTPTIAPEVFAMLIDTELEYK